MKVDHGKIQLEAMLNKIAFLYDFLQEYVENHERSLKDLLIQSGYEAISSKNVMISEFHVIDCIGKNHLPNATFISRELNMTKGAISKITAKLVEKDLIKTNRLENNRKEIYYTLTALGKEAFEIHAKLHEIENNKLIAIFTKYNNEELGTIYSFLDDLCKIDSSCE